jgi:hypothetical protein
MFDLVHISINTSKTMHDRLLLFLVVLLNGGERNLVLLRSAVLCVCECVRRESLVVCVRAYVSVRIVDLNIFQLTNLINHCHVRICLCSLAAAIIKLCLPFSLTTCLPITIDVVSVSRYLQS